jgi:hypothetical protein
MERWHLSRNSGGEPHRGDDPMSKVLVLNSSALGGASVSNQLVQDALVELRARDPGHVEKLAFGTEARQQALDGARAQLGQLLTENQYMRAA